MCFALELRKYDADDYHRIACIPAFAGLRRFPEGRGFKQWTGDNSRALMKVCGVATQQFQPKQRECITREGGREGIDERVKLQ